MPNWCDNDLWIRAVGKNKEQQLREFATFAQSPEGHIEFNNFVPYPARFTRMDKIVEELNTLWNDMRDESGIDRKTNPTAYEAWYKDHPPPGLSDGYNSGGYEWCVENWGTKWGACQAKLSKDEYEKGCLLYQFDTAWSPPLPIILAMSQRFPKLKFTLRYYECGAGFKGTYQVTVGQVLRDESGNYQGHRGG